MGKTPPTQEAVGVRRGACIHTEEPFVFVLNSKHRRERCDHCLKPCRVRKCSKCQYVSYCNEQCQLRAWPLHKLECPFLQRIHPRTVPDAARMLCRMIIRLGNGGDFERGYYAKDKYRRFRDLMSHYAEIKQDAQRIKHLNCLRAVLNDMMAGDARLIVPNETELMTMYGRLITNAFNVLDNDLIPIGTAIYLGVSITDHSCKPNAVATFEGTKIYVHAIEDMPELDWSKVFISYIDLLNTPTQRNADLEKNYFFQCACKRCVSAKESRDMDAAACRNPKCTNPVYMKQTICDKCSTVVSAKHREAYNDVIELTRTHLETMHSQAFLDVSKFCLKKQEGVLHPLNLWHVKTLECAFEAAIEMQKWQDALEFGVRLIAGFRKYHGDWNPVVGLLYMKIAKLQTLDNKFKEALASLTEARAILQVTHSNDRSLFKEQLLPMIEQAYHNAN